MAELLLNGILEEEVSKYYHICFFTDREGVNRENPDDYVFVPKVVCRILDEFTVCIQDWYVQKKKLMCYVRANRSIRRLARLDKPSQDSLSSKNPPLNKPYGAFRKANFEDGE